MNRQRFWQTYFTGIRWILLIVGILLFADLKAQEEREFTYQMVHDVRWHNLAWPLQSYGVDTGLAMFHLYDPVWGEMPPRRFLGNLGQPSQKLVWQPNDTRYFNMGWRQYRRQFRTWGDQRFYDEGFPYTHLFYVQGAKGEQRLNVTHYRKLGPNVQFGVDYLTHSINGFYANQQTSRENLNVYLQFETPSKRYGLTAGYYSNNVANGRNGGIDSAGLAAFGLDASGIFNQGRKDFLPVSLSGALSDYNRKTGFLRHHFQITRLLPDSLKGVDSLSRGVFRLFHEAAYSYGRYEYVDPMAGENYYETTLLRTDSTIDRSTWGSFRNTGGIEGELEGKEASMSGSASISWEPLIVRQQERNYYYDQSYLQGRWLGTLGQDRLEVRANGILHLTGYKSGDWSLAGQGHFELNDWFKLLAAVHIDRSQPDFMYQTYLSNHHYWEQTFEPVSQRSLMAGVAIPRLKTEFRIRPFNIGNYLYFNADRSPAQATSITGLVAEWEQKIKVGPIHLRQYLAFQQIDNSAPLNLPQLVTSHTVYGAFHLFQRILKLHAGFEVSYNTPYAADRFDPALGQFFLNEGDPVETYPVIDVFVSGKIRGARIFVMMSHVNQGLFGDGGLYVTPFYPIPDRSFKFGVSWRFFD